MPRSGSRRNGGLKALRRWLSTGGRPQVTQRPLLVLAGVGPTQAALAEAVHRSWGDDSAVRWLALEDGDAPGIVRRASESHTATCVIAVGVDAIHAAQNADHGLPIDGVILHDELDFRASNAVRATRLLQAFRSCARLWFDSTIAMDKACAHGSDRPHLLLPSLTPELAPAALAKPSHVLISIPGEPLTGSQERRVQSLQAVADAAGTSCSVMKPDDWVPADGLQSLRPWSSAIKEQLTGQDTAVVLVGKSSHHGAVADVAIRSGAPLLADATIENAALLRRLRTDERALARGAALTERLTACLATESAALTLDAPPTQVDFRAVFEAAADRALPNWHEDGVAALGQQAFDLFYSTAAIENRSDGARPQRIRSMSQAFESEDVPLVRITANANLLKRRLEAMLELVRAGAKPRWGYGENSTAPMPEASLEMLTSSLPQLRDAGLRFGWFVRDVHWLDPDSTVTATSADIESMRERGLAEFEAMRSAADLLFCPTLQSGERFDTLLSRHGSVPQADWNPLPPGIDPANILAPPTAPAGAPLTVLYAGGIGGVYDLTTIIHALRDLTGPWVLRMFVRTEDVEAATVLTGTLPPDRVRIASGELTDEPRTEGPVIGVALLDTDYGRASFPVKVMNYFERAIPVLLYADSAAAELATRYGLGSVVEASGAAVGAALSRERILNASYDWGSVHRQETWHARARQVRITLDALS